MRDVHGCIWDSALVSEVSNKDTPLPPITQLSGNGVLCRLTRCSFSGSSGGGGAGLCLAGSRRRWNYQGGVLGSGLAGVRGLWRQRGTWGRGAKGHIAAVGRSRQLRALQIPARSLASVDILQPPRQMAGSDLSI